MIANAPMGRTRSKLILRDSIIFLVLSLVTVVLFATTLLLFRSFEQHRKVLNERWSHRGRKALSDGKPETAVADLRTALSFEPNQLADQLLLSQALAASGRIEEATNYFLNLRESRPGDGFINLNLARLARRKGDAQEAIEYYRAAIFGNWQGDGVIRRREARLELVDYLAERGDKASAKAELFIAVGNDPEDATTDQMFGDRFSEIDDPADGLQFYQKALKYHPGDIKLLVKAGRLAFATERYAEAEEYLNRALAYSGEESLSHSDRSSIVSLAHDARLIPELRLSRDLLPIQRVDHILLASTLAQDRLRTCLLQPGASAPALPRVAQATQASAGTLQELDLRWRTAVKHLNHRMLDRNDALQDQTVQLIRDTELRLSSVCGAPTGDDALLVSELSAANGPVSGGDHAER